jgi:prepilin peptidase CpaA
MTLPLLLAMAAFACLLLACVSDVTRFEIPDSLSIAMLLLAIGFGLLVPGFAWGPHALAVLAMFAVGLLLFALGWMGGGDVKLLVAAAAWTGLAGLPALLIGMAFGGGLLALVLILTRTGARLASLPDDRMPRVFQAGAPMPYAIAITIGAAFWGWRAWPLV